MRVDYAIVFVSDMKKAISFYRDVIGMPLKFESPQWTEFVTEGATLALHASEGSDSEAGQCRPGLRVADLDAFHKRMVENKVTCLQEPKAMFGVRLAQYRDPDGLAFSVSEG